MSALTDDSYAMSNRPIEEVEAARLRSESVAEFPWIDEGYQPIRTQQTQKPPQWFTEGQAFNRGNSVRSVRSIPRESIVDLHLIVSDLDYYAGAVHDYQEEEEQWAQEEEEWLEENGGEWPLPENSDGQTFGQIQIVRNATLKRGVSTKSKKGEKDVNLVTWDGPDDPDNPKNWTRKKKWLATITVSLFTFISPVSSSMIAPCLEGILKDFHIPNDASHRFQAELAMSVFILAFAVGPLFLGPLAELFGRRIILQISNLFYFVFNLACGFSNNIGMIIAFRFLSGLGGSAPMGIGGGVLGDIWLPQERGKAMAMYSLMPLLGPAIGPIAGGFIQQYSTWRWVFYSTSIAAIFVQVLGIFFLRETYAAEILKRKKKQLIKITGNKDLHTEFDNPNRKFRQHLATALARPFKLLFTQPIVQVLALYIGYVYGVLYLVLASFPVLWTNPRTGPKAKPPGYGESAGIGGLNYISLGLGFYLGTQIAAKTADKIYKALKAKNDGVGRSEFRVPLMFPGAIMVPIGLLIYGWAAQNFTHWIVPNIGTLIFAAGNQLVFQNCQTYIVDSYTRFAASAIAATTVLRSLGGFAFPLFAPAMYGALGYGWGNTTLAFLGIAIGLPAPCILWWFGETLRKKSNFAVG
jgi:multidrug resistance protein